MDDRKGADRSMLLQSLLLRSHSGCSVAYILRKVFFLAVTFLLKYYRHHRTFQDPESALSRLCKEGKSFLRNHFPAQSEVPKSGHPAYLPIEKTPIQPENRSRPGGLYRQAHRVAAASAAVLSGVPRPSPKLRKLWRVVGGGALDSGGRHDCEVTMSFSKIATR
jgi:hypothetical protein